MDVIWNQNRMMNLLRSFHNLVKVRVGFFDLEGREIMGYPAGRMRYCELIRADKSGDAACRRCDAKAFREAAKLRKIAGENVPYIYQCHAGLTEMIAPIVTSSGERVGYLMIGQARQPGIRAGGKGDIHIGVKDTAKRKLDAAYRELTALTGEQARSCANILQSLAAYVWLDNYIRVQNEPLSSRVKNFIAANLCEDLSLGALARRFSVGKTTLCKSVKIDLKLTVNELVRQLRIEKARQLLESEDKPVAEVAGEVGIPDYNYFTKLFKQETGVTPSVFRRLCENEFQYLRGVK